MERPDVTVEKDPAKRVMLLYRLLYGRVPDDEELRLARAYVGANATPASWQQLAQALVEANEFVFLD
jgi:hypothetical protein